MMHHITLPVNRPEFIPLLLIILNYRRKSLHGFMFRPGVMAQEHDMIQLIRPGISDQLILSFSCAVTAVKVPVVILIPFLLYQFHQPGHNSLTVLCGDLVGSSARETDEAWDKAKLFFGYLPDLIQILKICVHRCVDFRIFMRICMKTDGMSRVIGLFDQISVTFVFTGNKKSSLDVVFIQNFKNLFCIGRGAVIKCQINNLLVIIYFRC